MSSQPWAQMISDWFGETLDDPAAISNRMNWWFAADPKRDRELGTRYRNLVEECANGRHYHWLDQPEGRLAMIIALDQLPRNLFRGTWRAFAHDPYTSALCLAAAQTGQDRKLPPIQRAFLYMPLQHMEDIQAQEAGVELYDRLGAENPEWPVFADGFAPFARQHRDIIARFGRFPHRNALLGRVSTEEEAEYLSADTPSFGQ
jgi:uncharacterized protein (DUF924 family)